MDKARTLARTTEAERLVVQDIFRDALLDL
jgi:hypothetical protein